MGRSGVKETTLDYEQVFAERRGLQARASGTSELDVAMVEAKVLQQDLPSQRRNGSIRNA